jgi:uncharacterized RDD family membrane protein YckC
LPRRVAGGRACRLYPVACTKTPSPSPPLPRALVGWRLLALLYDALPVIALWMLASTAFTLGYTFLGHHPARENIAPFSALQWLLWLCCWVITGLYAVLSWRRGGQTLGMRPWRLQLVDLSDNVPSTARCGGAMRGQPVAAAGGLGFWWAWIDRDRLAWHDRASGTRLGGCRSERRQPERRLNSRYDTSSMISGGIA